MSKSVRKPLSGARLPAGVAVTPLFLALMVVLAVFIAYYWFAILAPQLDANARASATALADSHAQTLADTLSDPDPETAHRRLASAMDEILIAREPTTDAPIFLGVRTEIDYDMVRAPEGLFNIDKRSGQCDDCLQIDVPLYSRATRELLGIAQFDANLVFLKALRQDVRDKLSIGAALMLVVIGGIWWAVLNLLRKIARSERNLRHVFEAAPVPMVLVRQRDDRILRGNRAAADLLGVPVGDLPSLQGREVHVGQGDEDPLSGPGARDVDVEGREIVVENTRGERHWVLASSHPISFLDEAAHILSYADITPLKQIQHELIDAKEAAEKATRAKSLFVANMSHEIRTPLNAVTGFCHLAERTQLDAKQRGYLTSIRKATDLLLGVINNILDFSKLDAGKLELDEIDFSVAALVSDLLDMFGVLADRKGLALDANIGDDVPDAVTGDEHRIKQVLTNLIGNALKFTESGRVKLGVELANVEGGSLMLRFEVSDTGIGIAPEAMASLFQSFTQADSSITRKHGGTGLGLAISRSLVELMGGQIGVRSEPDQGSAFWFTVCLATASGPVARRAPKRAAVLRRGAKVLVVDDNNVNRRIMVELLDALGVSADVAGDGVEAIAAVNNKSYDLVLMDLQMPNLDGYEATARLRERFDARQLPIIAMTAHGREEDKENCLAAGMNAHLSKPIDPNELALVLGHWLAVTAPASVEGARFGWPEELPGLHVAAGLARAGHKPVLYRQLLNEFAQDHVNSAARLRQAVEAGDSVVAARIAHNLKGTSANLGARTLETSLQGFERAQRENLDVAEALDGVRVALEEVLQSITELGPVEGAQVPARVDPDGIPRLVAALDAALKEGNFDAAQRLDALTQALAGQPVHSLEPLTQAVRAFDFNAARAALRALAESLVVPSGDHEID